MPPGIDFASPSTPEFVRERGSSRPGAVQWNGVAMGCSAANLRRIERSVHPTLVRPPPVPRGHSTGGAVRSAAVAAAPVTEAEAPAEKADEIEQQILAIIKMKASGDEAWVTELALFKQNYPDYPLPDELSN
mgnify:CR=1 FL=1